MEFLNEAIKEGNIIKIDSYLDKNEISENCKWILLKKAISLQHKELLKLFIAKGFRVNKKEILSFHNDETPLHVAVEVGCLESVNILLSNGASIEIQNETGDTPLLLAVKQQKYLIADLMLPKMSYVNYENHDGLSHMHVACIRNQVDIIKKFLQNGVERNASFKNYSHDYDGYTALHFAVKFQCIEAVDLLLKCGVDITLQNAKKESPLHIAYELQNEQIIDLILSAHTYEAKNPYNSDKLSHFHIACTRNNIQIITCFLHFIKSWYSHELTLCKLKSYDITFSPLHFAIKYECINVVKVLLDHVNNLDKPNIEVANLINLAKETKNRELIELIQAKLNCKNDAIKINDSSLALHEALLKQNLSEFNSILETGKIGKILYSSASIFWPGCTALHLAVNYQNIEAVKFLLKKGENIGAADARGKTCLHIAFESNQMEMVDLILSSESIVKTNPVDDCGLSHFHISCTRKNISTIKNFLKIGSDVNECVKVNSTFWPGFTPLHFAVTFRSIEVVQLLIRNGADITLKNGLDLTLIDQAFKSSGLSLQRKLLTIPFLIELLLVAREWKKIDNFPDKGISLLHIACAKNDIKSIKRLLNPGNVNLPVNADCPIWPGFTPLHFAAMYDSYEAIALLLKEGANTSIRDSLGDTPLHLVYNKYHMNLEHRKWLINERLISYNDNPTGWKGWSHFHIACHINNLKAVQSFLKLGVNINMRISSPKFDNIFDKDNTPLHLAVQHENSYSLVLLLLKNGADIEACGDSLRTPLHIAACRSSYEAAQLLLEYGANVEARDEYKQTPLHFATELEDDGKMVRLLLKYGADVKVRDEYLRTPLHYSMSGAIVDMLMEAGAEVNAVDVNGVTPILGMLTHTIELPSDDAYEAFFRHGADIQVESKTGSTFLRLSDLYFSLYSERLATVISLDPIVIFLKHIRKLMNLGLHVNEPTVQYYSTKISIIKKFPKELEFDEALFDIECQSEIDAMDFIKINNCKTLKNILFMKANQIARHADNVVFNNILRLKDFDERFPIYGYLLKLQSKIGLNRKPLMGPSEVSLIVLTGQKILNVCAEMILEYLSDIDLQNLIFSTKDILDKVQKCQ